MPGGYPTSPEVRRARAKVGGLTAYGADPDRITEARRLLNDARALAFIQELIQDNQLTPAGMAAVSALLHPEAADAP